MRIRKSGQAIIEYLLLISVVIISSIALLGAVNKLMKEKIEALSSQIHQSGQTMGGEGNDGE